MTQDEWNELRKVLVDLGRLAKSDGFATASWCATLAAVTERLNKFVKPPVLEYGEEEEERILQILLEGLRDSVVLEAGGHTYDLMAFPYHHLGGKEGWAIRTEENIRKLFERGT